MMGRLQCLFCGISPKELTFLLSRMGVTVKEGVKTARDLMVSE